MVSGAVKMGYVKTEAYSGASQWRHRADGLHRTSCRCRRDGVGV